jgi:hypothetical protein
MWRVSLFTTTTVDDVQRDLKQPEQRDHAERTEYHCLSKGHFEAPVVSGFVGEHA